MGIIWIIHEKLLIEVMWNDFYNVAILWELIECSLNAKIMLVYCSKGELCIFCTCSTVK